MLKLYYRGSRFSIPAHFRLAFDGGEQKVRRLRGIWLLNIRNGSMFFVCATHDLVWMGFSAQIINCLTVFPDCLKKPNNDQ